MLARLRGMVQSLKPGEADSSADILPVWDSTPPSGNTSEEAAAPPAAVPLVDAAVEHSPASPCQTIETEEPPLAVAEPVSPLSPVENEEFPQAAPTDVAATVPPMEAALTSTEAPVAELALCPACQSPYDREQANCNDCGYIFPPDTAPARDPRIVARAKPAPPRVKGRYELTTLLGERGGLARFRGVDYQDPAGLGVRIHVVRMAIPLAAAPVLTTEIATVEAADSDEVLPSFDAPPSVVDTAPHALPTPLPWPSVSWERDLLTHVIHPSLPTLLDSFVEDGYEYLVEEIPAGQSLWDAWDDPEVDAEQRYGWLKQLAETLHALHQHGALLEALRPDIVVVKPDGQARLTDLSDLLPLPLPADAPLRASLYTAPELVSDGPKADARADLFSFGAMLYALHVGRELTEMDFERQGGTPKPFIPRFPDVHPLFGRLVAKTFQRDPNQRFPTDEAVREDATGFRELIRTLEVCRRTLDNVRLEIASWTTTGIVRTGNEDAFALLHTVESRQDNLEDAALVLLADGMGGYEAGEIAAALAVQALRKNLLRQPMFRSLGGESPFPSDFGPNADSSAATFDVESCKELLKAALRDANKQVYTASRSGVGRRGMGCTAEAV
ncbi:MAG TPA: hypothetical protein VGG61_03740, partial [Gemmataceae bacterium]